MIDENGYKYPSCNMERLAGRRGVMVSTYGTPIEEVVKTEKNSSGPAMISEVFNIHDYKNIDVAICLYIGTLLLENQKDLLDLFIKEQEPFFDKLTDEAQKEKFRRSFAESRPSYIVQRYGEYIGAKYSE